MMEQGDRYFKILSQDEPQIPALNGYNYSPEGYKFHN